VLRRNGEGVRFLYDGVQAVEVRREADDALVAEYTYAQGFLMKLQKDTVEHWFTAFAQGGYPRHGFDLAGTLTDSFEYSTNGTLAYHQGATALEIGWAGTWVLGADSGFPVWLVPASDEVWAPVLAYSLNPGSRKRLYPPLDQLFGACNCGGSCGGGCGSCGGSCGGDSPTRTPKRIGNLPGGNLLTYSVAGKDCSEHPYDPDCLTESIRLCTCDEDPQWPPVADPPGGTEPPCGCQEEDCDVDLEAIAKAIASGSQASPSVDPGLTPLSLLPLFQRLPWEVIRPIQQAPAPAKRPTWQCQAVDGLSCACLCGATACAAGLAQAVLAKEICRRYAELNYFGNINDVECNNDAANAFRHCIWNCLMQRDPNINGLGPRHPLARPTLGALCPVVMGLIHEATGTFVCGATTGAKKDLENNMHGIDCGFRLWLTCEDCCLHKIATGELNTGPAGNDPTVKPPPGWSDPRWPPAPVPVSLLPKLP